MALFFYQFTPLYGHNQMACSKKGDYGQNGQKFTDKSLENGGLSVKCVLLTDKPSKKDSLSVKLE